MKFCVYTVKASCVFVTLLYIEYTALSFASLYLVTMYGNL